MGALRDIVIVGAGQAGGGAALALRQGGFAGSITLVGDEPHPPYERPPLSKEVLLGTRSAESTYLQAADAYAAQDIRLRTGARVDAIDPRARRVALADSSQLPYDALILATGGRARRLRLPGIDLPGIHHLRDIADATALRAVLAGGGRLVVLGGGYIGLEVAASARQCGAAVSVVEIEPALLRRAAPAEASGFLTALHRDHGVDLRLGARVVRIEGAGRVERVVLADGTLLDADAVVVGVGLVPNTELAEVAGIAAADGIAVDEFGATSAPGIYAVGDVARHPNPVFGCRWRLESWQHAQNHGLAVARNLCGTPVPYAEVPWFWTDQYDANLQMVGIMPPGAAVARRGDPAERGFTAFYLDRGRLVGALAVDRPRDIRAARQLIAACAAPDPASLADERLKLAGLLPR